MQDGRECARSRTGYLLDRERRAVSLPGSEAPQPDDAKPPAAKPYPLSKATFGPKARHF